jgi:hypothetical protein
LMIRESYRHHRVINENLVRKRVWLNQALIKRAENQNGAQLSAVSS